MSARQCVSDKITQANASLASTRSTDCLAPNAFRNRLWVQGPEAIQGERHNPQRTVNQLEFNPATHCVLGFGVREN